VKDAESSSHAFSISEARLREVEATVKAMGLTDAEQLVASAALAYEAARRIAKSGREWREVMGRAPASELARGPLADAVAQLQDAATAVLRAYNTLLRDEDQDSITE